MRKFRRHRLAIAGLLSVAVLALLTAAAPWAAPFDPDAVDLSAFRQPPNAEHWLGTDSAGRDVLSRLVWGGRISLVVGLGSMAIASATGVVVGLIAGLRRGVVDSLIMRAVDVVLAFPILVVVITVVALIGPSLYTIIVSMGFVSWPVIARLVRGMALSLREQEFVLAARTVGTPDVQIMFRHLLPNVLAPVIVASTFGIATTILMEAALSFLGLGVPPPTASWGSMLTSAQTLNVLESMPWMWVPPGALISLTVLSVNFIGDGLRDALDPRQQV